MIHIAVNIDYQYVEHCAVTLVSAFVNNPGEAFTVHVIADRLPEPDRQLLDALCSQYQNEVVFHQPDMSMLSGFTIRKFSKRISLATYYRCILADILPVDVNRVLYLDCDIVVLDRLRPFWETDLEGLGVAVVEDIGSDEASRYAVLHYPMELRYFNAGVLLINLEYWRQHNVTQACISYYRQYPERILFNDQDLLNSVLCHSRKYVDVRWNVQDGFYRRSLPADKRNEIGEALLRPAILHYTNRKPWSYDSQHPLRHEYDCYLALVPWRRRPAVMERAWNGLRRLCRLFPFYVGLRKPKYIRLNQH